MKRTVITITVTLLVIKIAKEIKEIKSLAGSKQKLESYLLGKQIDRNERQANKRIRDVGHKLAGHNIMSGHGGRDRTGHNVTTDDSATESLNYHQATMS